MILYFVSMSIEVYYIEYLWENGTSIRKKDGPGKQAAAFWNGSVLALPFPTDMYPK